jgi:outer membrane receptor protein involved in Fe transport
VELQSGESGHLQKDTMLSNHFKYTEQVYAAYLNVSGKLAANTNLMLGIRAEHTHSIGNSLTLNNIVRRNYLNLFPSLFLTRTLNKKNSLAVSYSYRIDRPNYQNLNPARSYLDPYTYSSGNAFLKPQYTHSLEFRHGYKEKIFTSLGASFIKDLQFFVIQPLDDKMARRMPENIGESEAYSLTVSFPIRVNRGWTIQGTIMGNYSIFDYSYKGSQIHVQQMAGRFNASNAFTFGKGWTGELMGRLNTPAVNALQRTPWLGSLDAGIQKTLGTRWKAKFSVQDVLHTNWALFRIDVPGFESRGRIIFDTRVAMLNLSYSFGNQQLKSSRQRKTAAEEEVQRTN